MVEDGEIRGLVEDNDVEGLEPTVLQVVNARDLKDKGRGVLELTKLATELRTVDKLLV